MIWNAAIMIGGMMLIAGMLGNYIEQSNADSRNARAVRAFFKAYTDSHNVSATQKLEDGEWVIHARSLDDRGAPFTAVPTGLLLKLSEDTGMTTPWTKIVVDPAKEPTP